MAPSPLILYGFYTQDINSRKRYNMLLDAEERKRRDRQIPRVAIKRFKDCLFLYLYNSGNNQALLNLTGCNHENFSKLLHKFHSKYDSHTFDSVTGLIRPKKQCLFGPKGRPRELNAIGGLGLVLMWFRTRGSCARSLSYYSSDLTDDEYEQELERRRKWTKRLKRSSRSRSWGRSGSKRRCHQHNYWCFKALFSSCAPCSNIGLNWYICV